MNARPCSDVITELTEKVYCKWIGDLPITATDISGRSPSCARRTYRRRRNRYSAVRASTLDTAALGLPLWQPQLDTRRPVRRRVLVHVLRQNGPIRLERSAGRP
eukprot:3553228-Prymnesium_polylepis.1